MKNDDTVEVIVPFNPEELKKLNADLHDLAMKYRDTVDGVSMYSAYLRHAILMGGAMNVRKENFMTVADQGWDYFNAKRS